MKRFRADYMTTVDVVIHDQEKAAGAFLAGDWTDVYWDLADLNELAESMAEMFLVEGDLHSKDIGYHRAVEGYGTFVQDADDDDMFTNLPSQWPIEGRIDLMLRRELVHLATDELKNIENTEGPRA